jgi:hypothetical protein
VLLAYGLLAALALAGAAPLPAAEPDPELGYAEQTLREARVTPDGPTLLRFFRQRTLSRADRARLAELVRRLGADDFQERQRAFRELGRAGPVARPFLEAAHGDLDPEIARSADRLLKRLESGAETTLTAAAARVLAARKPAGAVKVLLAYLPVAGEEFLQEAVFDALAAAGVRDGQIDPDLTAALRDKDPLLRLAAAHVYGRRPPGERKALRPLLADADDRVRFHAAADLVRAGDKSAVDTLIALVGGKSEDLAGRTEDLLGRIAGEQSPETPGLADPAQRRASQKAWEAWWRGHAGKVDLSKLGTARSLRGLTVIVEHDNAGKDGQGRIWECGKDTKPRWELNTGLGGPLDVHCLPNGRVLVAEYKTRRVTERDRKGNVLWQHKCNNSVLTCQRLANGNTLITTMNEILEVTRAGKTVLSYAKPNVYYAEKLPNRHILYVTGTQVVEIDGSGKEVRAINLSGTGWGCAEKLPNGRYLVGLYGANKVVEVDGTGKVFREFAVSSPTRATRLPNGHTLVSSSQGNMVVEFDRLGKEVWKVRTTGRVWRVRRY